MMREKLKEKAVWNVYNSVNRYFGVFFFFSKIKKLLAILYSFFGNNFLLA